MRGFTLCLSVGRDPLRVQFEFEPTEYEPAEVEEAEAEEDEFTSADVEGFTQAVEDCQVLYANRTAMGFGGRANV